MCRCPKAIGSARSRNPYYANQQLLANKQFRWWWNNTIKRSMTTATASDGRRMARYTEWVPHEIDHLAEYGFPACDKGTNQPNVFYSPRSGESLTPFWSTWDPPGHWPRRDDLLYLLACRASRYNRSSRRGQ